MAQQKSQIEVGAGVAGPAGALHEEQILEELRAIDTSALEKLTEIRAEQLRLAHYCEKGTELKGTVKEAVWQRVLAEYAARSATLEELAEPLKGALQQAYQKLKAIQDRLTASYDEALLAKEELEFREAVGELTKVELKAKLDGPQAILDRCQRDLAAVRNESGKFAAAMGSEAGLEKPPAQRVGFISRLPSLATPAETRDRPTTPEAVVEAATAPETSDAPVKVDEVPVTTPVTTHATRIVSTRAAALRRPRASVDSEDQQRTFILKRAAVFVTQGGAETTEHRLGAVSQIGRTEENHIRITGPGVSRRHALIKAAPTGFTLKDFGSQNGTFVNGERLSEAERPLAEGDRIVIGDAQILFRFLS